MRIGRHHRDKHGHQNLEEVQGSGNEGQDDDFEDFSPNGPSGRLENSTIKQSGRAAGGDDLPPLFSSNVELLLSRIARAQEDMVLVTKNQELKTTAAPITPISGPSS